MVGLRYLHIISLVASVLAAIAPAFGHGAGEPDDLVLYRRWAEDESRDSVYREAYRNYVAEMAAGNDPASEMEESHVSGGPSIAKSKRGTVQELEMLSVQFTEAFWVEKDYDKAFYIGLQLEELLPLVSESDYPGKRRDYFKLGEAYYLFLDNYKSIELLEKALAPVPLSFRDHTNLDAMKIIGICYANIADWQKSDDYFRATLLSNDIVLGRPLYNAYAISHLGCNAMLKGQYDLALQLSDAVWPAIRETDDYGHLAGMCYCQGRSHLQKGDFKQAEQWVDSLMYFARKDTYNPTKRIKQAYSLQADYYTALGYAGKVKVYSDSLVGIYKTEEKEYTSQYIVRASQSYNNDKIADQALQLRAGRTRIIAITAVALFSIGITLVIASLYRKKNAAYKSLARRAEDWAQEGGAALPRASDVTDNGATAKRPKANGMDQVMEEDKRIMSLADREMAENYAYREPSLSSEQLADRLGVHRNALSRAINKVTGGNYYQYINGYRVKEAIIIISQTGRKDMYINEICERVGFSSRGSFYRAFKQFTGLSPAEFQKNMTSENKNEYG